MKTRIIFAIGMICLLASCIEEADINDFGNVTPTPGKEIAFSASLGKPQTRTVYGSETSTSIKVKWVHDDLISVYGTTCSVKQADYRVKTYVKDADKNVTDEILASTPNVDTDGQNYADDLVKTGEAGVQWGSETVSDFYAVYPSISGSFFPIEETVDNEKITTAVVLETYISPEQYSSFAVTQKTIGGKSVNVVKGTPYNSTDRTYGMSDAIMYAYTSEAASGQTVDLNFKPFSTVLRFTLSTWHGESDSELEGNETGKSIKVNSISLQAPDNIAGSFPLTLFNDGTAEASEGTTNKITIVPSEEITWTYGQYLEFSVFIIPLNGLELSANWKVTVNASDGSRTFSLKPTTTSVKPEGEDEYNPAELIPGLIHNVNVTGFPVFVEWKYNPSTWITTIPRNVYISDLSLPGAWYATDSGYQGGTLQDQYDAGIRAFNIDCRLTLAEGKDVNDYDDVTKNQYADNPAHVTDGTLVLACAGTETHHQNWIGTPDGRITEIKKTVKQALIELGSLVIKNTDEYIEVILTVAQKPKDYEPIVSGLFTYGTVNPKMILHAISEVLNDPDVSPYVYGSKVGETITPNTTVNDVCGRILVKVNINTSDSKLQGYNYAAPMLISEGSMASSSIGYISGDVIAGSFAAMNSPAMYWSNNYSAGGMKYYYHQAQATIGAPTVDQRKTAIKEILQKSYDIYKNNTHDAMFQLGIGGWTGSENSTKPKDLSAELNSYVYKIINSMLTGAATDDGTVYTPAPVGAVLMNFATAGTDIENDERDTRKLIKAIIDLNGKYFLNRDTNKPAWPSEDGGSDEGGQDDPNQDDGTGGGSEGDQGEV